MAGEYQKDSGKEVPILSDILDISELKGLMDDLFMLSGLSTAIIDLEGRVLAASHWQEACLNYHRKNPETCSNCIKSDTILTKGLKKGQHRLYKCINGLWDASTPILLGKSMVANLFVGQFFFDDEEINTAFFAEIAEKCKFNKEKYMDAIHSVPRISRKRFSHVISYYVRLAGIISDMGKKNSRLLGIIRERDSLLESLTKSEEKLRNYIEYAPEGIFITDNKGIFTEVNRAACEITGYSKKDLLGRSIMMMVPRTEHGIVQEHIKRINKVGRTYVELPFIHKNGRTRYWSVDSICISDNTYAGFTKDITERKLSEEKLEKLADEYEKVFNGLQEAMFLVRVKKGREFRFVRGNTSFQEMAGSELTDISGKTAIELAGEELGKKIEAGFQECIRMKKPYYSEQSINLDGRAHTWMMTLTPVIEEGRIRYIIGSAYDITITKSAEESLKRQLSFEKFIAEISSAFINASIDNIHEIIDDMLKKACHFFEVDRGYIYEFFDSGKKMQKIYEHSRDPFHSRLRVKRSLKDYPWWAEQIRNNEYIYIEDIEKMGKEAGVEKKVFLSQKIKSLLNILIKKGDEVIGFLGFDSVDKRKKWTQEQIALLSVIAGSVFDALSRNRMEIEIIKSRELAISANKAKSDFLASISHEIRTPLNGIIGFIDLLMATGLDENQRQYLDNVNISAKSLLDILNDILDFSKIEAGKLELNEEKTDLWSLVENAVDITKYSAEKKSIEFLLDISPGTPRYIMADGLRLKQVLINLLSNAIKFTDKGEVEFCIFTKNTTASADEAEIYFSIRDTGIGIPEKDHEKVFSGFFQVDSTTTKKHGGTGLGLSITSSLLEKMGSRLNLKSMPGRGSTFSFCLKRPFSLSDDQRRKVRSKIKNVMVIDDNLSSLRIIKTFFEHNGIRCETFSEGGKALDRLKSDSRFDLIITDLDMPVMNGMETALRILNETGIKRADCPIAIMMNSREEYDNEAQIRGLGIKYRIHKPVRITGLYNILEGSAVPQTKYEKPSITCRKEYSITSDSGRVYVILIAEDNSINMMLIKNIIQKLVPNSLILEAKDGKEAVSLYSEYKPDLILMDIQMPVMDGYSSARYIRETEKGIGDTPIVALTARATPGEKERCTGSGMNDYISKPITRNSLIPVLEKYLTQGDDTEAHFNKNLLIRNLYNDMDLFIAMVKESLNVMPGYINEIRNCLVQKDYDLVRKKAHKIKGASLTMQFLRLSEIARAIETNPSITFGEADALISELEKEMDTVNSLLKKEIP